MCTRQAMACPTDPARRDFQKSRVPWHVNRLSSGLYQQLIAQRDELLRLSRYRHLQRRRPRGSGPRFADKLPTTTVEQRSAPSWPHSKVGNWGGSKQPSWPSRRTLRPPAIECQKSIPIAQAAGVAALDHVYRVSASWDERGVRKREHARNGRPRGGPRSEPTPRSLTREPDHSSRTVIRSAENPVEWRRPG